MTLQDVEVMYISMARDVAALYLEDLASVIRVTMTTIVHVEKQMFV